MGLRFAASCAFVLVAACGQSTPPRPPEQGARLYLDSAYWELDESVIEVFPNGEVLNGDVRILRLDRAGRVEDADGELVAMLLGTGDLLDDDGDRIGWVGAGTSYTKDSAPRAHVFPTGEVAIADKEGVFQTAGSFRPCNGRMLWTCTLVIHLIASKEMVERATSGSLVGGTTPLDFIRLLEILRVFR